MAGAPQPRRWSGSTSTPGIRAMAAARSAVVPPVAQQVAPAHTVAAQLYEAQQYPAALGQLAGVVTMLHQARQAYPALPEL